MPLISDTILMALGKLVELFHTYEDARIISCPTCSYNSIIRFDVHCDVRAPVNTARVIVLSRLDVRFAAIAAIENQTVGPYSEIS